MRKLQFLIIFLIFVYPVAAFSTSVVAVPNFPVSSTMMDGMLVDIDFSDAANAAGQSDVTGLEWGVSSTFGVSDGTSTPSWSLTYTGTDTSGWNGSSYDLDWVLSSDYEIDSFTIYAIPGDTVFDIVFQDDRTFDSSGGIWIPNGATGDDTSGSVTDTSFFNDTFRWEFSDAVYLVGDSPLGDLYSTLTIDFTANGGTSFISANGVDFEFVVDTDNVTPTPEPATMLLFGIGLLGISAIGRRKKN